jgi:murein DD-endopeptidase MepM/ murein hydrolase activator NlpD
LQQSKDGGKRRADRLRPDRSHTSVASRVNHRAIHAARAVRSRTRRGVPVHIPPIRALLAGFLRSLATAERALPIAVAAIVAAASLLSLLPSPSQGAVGSTHGQGSAVRLAIGGANASGGQGDVGGAGDLGPGTQSFEPLTIPDSTPTVPVEAGAFLNDGTLVTGYAPLTTVQDGASLIQTYKVKSGDTLVAIAAHFGVSMMTLWWANKLTSKDALHIGQILRIPPVNGLVVTVADTDTLDSLAAKYGVDSSDILSLNNLTDPTLVVGQTLIVPGAKGTAIPTPKPTPKPAAAAPRTASSSSSRSSSSSSTSSYTGGRLQWPVVGGGNYISQYYHYGHWAIDIAADYGAPVVAAAAGVVTFAGWKNNGGGYQVWISHGGNLYTTYNHMSAITVGVGQSVARGRQVGRIGQSGDATGPHLHFEVWVGAVWNGGTRMNPLSYLR